MSFGPIDLVRVGQIIARLLDMKDPANQCIHNDDYLFAAEEIPGHMPVERCIVDTICGDVALVTPKGCGSRCLQPGDHILIKRQAGYVIWKRGARNEITREFGRALPYLILSPSDILAVIDPRVLGKAACLDPEAKGVPKAPKTPKSSSDSDPAVVELLEAASCCYRRMRVNDTAGAMEDFLNAVNKFRSLGTIPKDDNPAIQALINAALRPHIDEKVLKKAVSNYMNWLRGYMLGKINLKRNMSLGVSALSRGPQSPVMAMSISKDLVYVRTEAGSDFIACYDVPMTNNPDDEKKAPKVPIDPADFWYIPPEGWMASPCGVYYWSGTKRMHDIIRSLTGIRIDLMQVSEQCFVRYAPADPYYERTRPVLYAATRDLPVQVLVSLLKQFTNWIDVGLPPITT